MSRNVARLRRETAPLASMLGSWVLDLESAGKSPHTIRAYRGSVLTLIGHAGDAATTGITTEDLRAFMADQLRRLAPETVAGYRRNLNVFFGWLAVEEPSLVPVNPMRGVAKPQAPRKRRPPFSEEELKRLLAAASGPGFEERRDAALMRVEIDTGMRLAGLAGLRLRYFEAGEEKSDVLLGQRLLVIRLKGGRENGVPIGRKTSAALDRYMRSRARRRDADEEWLWLGHKGQLTGNGIRQAMQRRAVQAGVSGMYPHRFRRTFAHQWLLDGGTELDLMSIAGWTTRAMIDVYAGELSEQRARLAHARLSPGDRL